MTGLFLILLAASGAVSGYQVIESKASPLVITTWAFRNATLRAWDVLSEKRGSAVDAIERGCTVCELEQCDFTVGFGGSPDETGETTLDAMIMDGETMKVGAVGGLRRVKTAISVARRVLDHSKHSFLVGDAATAFAKSMGFKEESLSTPYSQGLHKEWLKGNCQPNHWVGVVPDPTKSCGPYKPKRWLAECDKMDMLNERGRSDGQNHDTIGMVAMDVEGRVASGTSTNGLIHKIPGRVGDSPIAGAGSYADSSVGGAASTGDGDIMMRFLPSFVAVEEMKKGRTAREAARTAVRRIMAKHPKFFGAVIAMRRDGSLGAACNGMEVFEYYIGTEKGNVQKMEVACEN